MARSVLYQNTIPSYGTWYHSTAYPGWVWKANTSSDEVCGHMMVYPLVYHYLAETPEVCYCLYSQLFHLRPAAWFTIRDVSWSLLQLACYHFGLRHLLTLIPIFCFPRVPTHILLRRNNVLIDWLTLLPDILL